MIEHTHDIVEPVGRNRIETVDRLVPPRPLPRPDRSIVPETYHRSISRDCALAQKFRPDHVAPLRVNGLPVLLFNTYDPKPRIAPQSIFAVDVDDDGRIRAIFSILAPGKLVALRPPSTTTPRSP